MTRTFRGIGQMAVAPTHAPAPPGEGANLRGLVIVPDAHRAMFAPVMDREAIRRSDLAHAITPSLGALLADDECRHGRLAHDPTPPCGCWPHEPEKEHITVQTVEATHPETDHTPADPEAPFGYKADGTPRKRPAPSAEHMAAAGAARDRYFAERRAAKAAEAAQEAPPAHAPAPEAAPEPDPAPEPVTPVSGPLALLVRIAGEVDGEIARLEGELGHLRAVRDALPVPA